jgi:hypothetical protein
LLDPLGEANGPPISDNEAELQVLTQVAMAWEGYQSKGRGAVVARIHFPGNDASAAVIDQSFVDVGLKSSGFLVA